MVQALGIKEVLDAGVPLANNHSVKSCASCGHACLTGRCGPEQGAKTTRGNSGYLGFWALAVLVTVC